MREVVKSRATFNANLSLPVGVLLLVFLAAFSFGAVVKVAWGAHYHVACVGNGFVHGESTNDNSFFSRVEAGCGSEYRSCQLKNWSSYSGHEAQFGISGTCNLWNREFPGGEGFTECQWWAIPYARDVVGHHRHDPHNGYCGL